MKLGTIGVMILIFKQSGRYPARVLPNVVDICTRDDILVWKIGRASNQFRKGIPVDVMEYRYQFAYALCGDNDCARMGVGDSLIKWLVWGNVWIADFTLHEAQRYIKKNPIQITISP